MLRKIAHGEIMTGRDGSGFQREHAGKNFQEGRFARTIRTDEDGSLAPHVFQIKPLIDDMGAVCLFHTIERDGPFSAATRLGKGKGDRCFIPFGGLDAFHPIELFDTILCLGGLACLGTESVDEALEFGNFALLIFVGGPLLFLACGLLGEISIVVAPVAVELSVTDFENIDADGIQEFAVVGDSQNRTAVLREVVLKPSERFEIEMVRRFIQHQDVGLHDEQPGQVSTHDPATAEGACRFGDISFTECQTTQNTLGFHFEGVAVEFGKACEGLVMNGVFLLGMFPEQAAHFFHCRRDIGSKFEYRLVARRSALLGEKAHGRVPFQCDGSRVGRGFLENQRKEG